MVVTKVPQPHHLGVGDVSQAQAFYEALGWYLDWAGGRAPVDGPDQPRLAANQRIPGGLVTAKAAASWDTGLTARPSPGTRGPLV
jgi:hypothetical protein